MGKLITTFNIIRAYTNWPKWFLIYFNLVNKKYSMIKTRQGEKFAVRIKDQDTFRMGEIFHTDKYTRMPIRGGTVVDIGAHCGFFSVYASRYAENVYSFEPMASTFSMLKKNIALNKKEKKIKAFNMGVSKKAGMAKLYTDNDAARNSLYKKTDVYEEITLTTLPDIFEKNKINVIEYLKMNCEGAEFEILLNCPKKYFSRINRIVMEYHDDPNFRGKEAPRVPKLAAFLREQGFRVDVVPNGPASKELGNMYALKER